ncbi:MAG: magnesium transporter [Euryarchaeota archaeon]|nr:magnesium transporter [Euryarchaeota archaeon]
MKIQQGIGSQWKLLMTGLVALLVSTFAAVIAGMYLGTVRDVLELLPALMVLLPASINMRGSISGIFASRLSSSMHLGAFEVDFSDDSVLGINLRLSFSSTVIIAFVLGIFAYIICMFFGIGDLGLLDIIIISLVSGVISGLIVIGITLLVTLLSYRYELDLDMIAAPTVTTSGDLVTLPILLLTGVFILQLDTGIRVMFFGAISLILLIYSIYSLSVQEDLKDIAREIVPLLISLSFIGTLAGLTYAMVLDKLVAYAAFLILIPPFAGGCGSIAGILCSRLATGMHMGAVSPSYMPEKEVFSYFRMTYIYALIVFPLLAVTVHGASILLMVASPGLLLMILITLGSGLVVLTLTNVIAYITASLSFRYGLDPDNFGIPVITGVIDLVGATVLVAAINILL